MSLQPLRSKLLPQSLVGRVIALLLLALATAQGINAMIFIDERKQEVKSAKIANLMSRTASIIRLLDNTPSHLHTGMLQAITTPNMHFWMTDQSTVEQHASLQEKDKAETRFTELINSSEQDIRVVIDQERPAGIDLRDTVISRSTKGPYMGEPIAIIAIKRSDGKWLNSAQLSLEPMHGWAWTLVLSMSFLTLTIIVVVILLRRITRPLAKLTAASDRLGRGEEAVPVAEEGPEDMCRTIRAFNQMQDRLIRFVQDRTRMLAAISHDLRTPLTTLRLRTELIDDDDTRKKFLETVCEMQQMTEAVLAFARDDAKQEDTHVMDLATFIDSLCQDMTDLGANVSFTPTQTTSYACRPVSLKRALRNLIENAVAYGDSATVTLQKQPDNVVITVEDEGPGISVKDAERVFEPFVRLDESRNKATGGIGLGLSIARSIIHSHGGEIALNNKQTGGLCITIKLPLFE